MLGELTSTYVGVVEDNRDPEGLGRLRVRVPHVYGPSQSEFGSIATNDLPWALPIGLPAGGTSHSGGITWLPESGDQVYVRFLDGEPEKPIWEWGNQTRNQKKTLELHQYDNNGRPRLAAMTRYGHRIEFDPKFLMLATSKINAFILDDSMDGAILQTNRNFIQNIGQAWIAVAQRINFESTSLIRFSSDTATVLEAEDLAVSIDNDIIVTGTTLTTFINGVTLQTFDGTLYLCDKAGDVIVFDGAGHLSIASPNGTNVSLADNRVDLAIPSGASVTVQKDQISLNSGTISIGTQIGQITLIQLGQTLRLTKGTNTIDLATDSIKLTVGTRLITADSTGLTLTAGGRTLKITEAGFNFT